MNQRHSRFYRDERDLERMLALVTASAQRDGYDAGHLHRGDVVWGLFQNLTIDPATAIRLFEDGAGRLQGFVWLHPPDAFLLQLDPAVAGHDTVGEMVAWTERHLADTPARWSTEIASTDRRLRSAFEALGYRPTGSADFQLNVQDLIAPLPEAALPPGAVVRPVDGDDAAAIAARVALHREVWNSSRFTADGYRRLRERPVYRPDLDLVAATPDGDLAAYAIVWWDEATRTGEFEPVGTAVRHRRRGYGKALLRDALRRLHVIGAEHAVVISATSEETAPSRALYESTGFRPVLAFDNWERPADGVVRTTSSGAG